MTRRCRSCGTQVTRDFIRVFGDNNGAVYGCLECEAAAEIHKGAAAQETGQ